MSLKDDPFFLRDENPPDDPSGDHGGWSTDDPGSGGGGSGGDHGYGGDGVKWGHVVAGGGSGGSGSGSGSGSGENDDHGSWGSDPSPDDEDPDAGAPSYEEMHVPCVLLRITDPDRAFFCSPISWPLSSHELKTERRPLLKFYKHRHLAKSCSGRLMLGGPCAAYPAGLLWLPERVKPVILFHFDWTSSGTFEVQARWQSGHYDHRKHGKMRIDTWGESTGMVTFPVTEWKTVALVKIDENGIWINQIRADLAANFRLLAGLN
ncbi:MAG: hypothetical protein V8T90_15465 [Victivallales bacterium]